MKIDWVKVGLVAIGVVLVGLLVVNVKSCVDAKAEREALQQDVVEMKRLSDDIVRSQSKYVTQEDLNKFGENLNINLNVIREDLAKRNAEIQVISAVLASSLGRRQSGIPSTGTHPRPDGTSVECEDPYGYWDNSQMLGLTEPFPNEVEVPIGSVTFEAWKEKPWSVDIRPRDYHVTTVLGQDKKGRHYAYNKFEIGVDGKRYPVEIKDAKLVEKLPETSFSWWNPRVGIGVHGGIGFNTGPLPGENVVTGVLAPTVSFSPFSYGQTETKPDWIFGRLGVGMDVVNQTANFSLAPAMWNIGSEVPFIQNTYVGPVVGADHRGNVGVGVGVTTDF